MNADQLLEHFHRIADASDAIPRLRRFVLDLAARGTLVPQDSNDEPASELLRRIAAERALTQARRSTHHHSEPISRDEAPFEIPSAWSWTRLGAIAELVRGISFPASAKSDNPGPGLLPCFRSGNVQLEMIWDDFIFVPRTALRNTQQLVHTGDILISIANSYELVGKCAIVKRVQEQATFGAFLAAVRLYLVSPEYIRYILSSEYSANKFRLGSAQTTNIANITFATIRDHPVPLPPLPEQHRIAAKVDELMALCDRLQTARSERETRRDRLTAASLARLNEPNPDAAAFAEHAHFALNNLDALTTRPRQVKQLRQTILNLAIRGRLVPQDPNDQPASEMLKQIAAWRSRAVTDRKIRAPRKPLSEITRPEVPYDLPIGWEWSRLGNLIYIRSGDGLTAEAMRGGHIPVFGGNGVAGFHDQSNVEQATVVIGRVGYYCGSVHVTPSPAWVTDNAFVTHFCTDAIFQEFLVLLLSATNLKENEKATAQPVISGSKIYPIVVGLPPLAEQHRIVAKVDQLMALCDRLEASLTSAQDHRRRLLDALLAEALSPVEDVIPAEAERVAATG
jgi:type I restriction enzyme, S subunit